MNKYLLNSDTHITSGIFHNSKLMQSVRRGFWSGEPGAGDLAFRASDLSSKSSGFGRAPACTLKPPARGSVSGPSALAGHAGRGS